MNDTANQILMGRIRHFLTLAGGALVTHGVMSGTKLNWICGGLAALLGFFLSENDKHAKAGDAWAKKVEDLEAKVATIATAAKNLPPGTINLPFMTSGFSQMQPPAPALKIIPPPDSSAPFTGPTDAAHPAPGVSVQILTPAEIPGTGTSSGNVAKAAVGILIAAILLPFTGLFTSCSTTTSVTGTTNSTGVVTYTTNTTQTLSPTLVSGIQIVAKTGTQIALGKDPSSLTYFNLGSQAVLALIASTNYSPAALTAALDSPQLKTVNGTVAVLITDAVTLYSSAYSEAVAQKLNLSTSLNPVLNAIAWGIQQGITAGPITLK